MMTMRYGYKASAEQFAPRQLIDYARHAEQVGLGTIAISDHYQPWRHTGGHAPNAIAWLGAIGEATDRAILGTSVLTPTLRYQPAIIAQVFATLGCLAPGRVFLGVGTGEAMNERPVTGLDWPGAKERRMRLAEAIKLIKLLWSEERVDFQGDYYSTEKATVYDKPEQTVPIYVAASGPLAAKLAGRTADGFICTSGKDAGLYEELTAKVAEGAQDAGRDPAEIDRMIEIKVSYDRDADYAREACAFWAALALTPDEKSGISDPIQMEQAADKAVDRAHTRFIVSDDPDTVVDKIRPYVDLGFRHLVFHAPGHDQVRFLDQFSEDVLPKLHDRFGATELTGITAAAT